MREIIKKLYCFINGHKFELIEPHPHTRFFNRQYCGDIKHEWCKKCRKIRPITH